MKENTRISPKGTWDPAVTVEENHYYWDGEPTLRPAMTDYQSNDQPVVVDLFSGCGGFSTGFSQAGFLPVLGIDIHPPSINTYALNHPSASVILGDIRRVKENEIRKAINRREVDVLTAGVPCQGFSLCNRKRHDEDARNYLFREFIRIVRFLKPKVVVLENVSGIRSAKGGSFGKAIKQAIADSGYMVDCQTLNALDYGVPQIRQRVFFQGVRKGLEIRWPSPTHGPGKEYYRMVRDALGDLPVLKAGEQVSQYTEKPSTEYQHLMRRESHELLNHEAPSHPPSTIKKIAKTRPGEPMYPTFKQRIRLHLDRPSPTQVCGGIRPQFQFGHPSQPRGLSVRERCRIQSFPDHFRITGGIVQGRVQTGNAVPPLLAQALALQIKRMLKGDRPTEETLSKESAPLELFA